ncbi:hypothetical protein QP938_07205 [Porticoccaceae bacterium LTM1]|nr:hypothetical protein QP938_07205 [Porticoccaceae bacterium LTM1]
MTKTAIMGFAALLAMTAGFTTSVSADELRVPVGKQAPEKQDIERPKNGQKKQQVEKKFGEPERKVPAVGEPPISSWEYPDFIVYFEHDLVLHTVLKGAAKPVE